MMEALKEPTFYFVGVTTGGSLSMKLFPMWLEAAGWPRTAIRGYDVEVRGSREKYREILSHIKQDPLALGGLVTTHKIDILAAGRDLFDFLDPYARIFQEVSSISKRGGALRGHAKDPITAGRALESFLPARYWLERPRAQAFIIGAGGSGIALSAYMMREEHGENLPSRILISNRSRPGLEHCREVHRQVGVRTEVEYLQVGDERSNDDILAGLPEGSLVVNATGMGKDTPGSPLSDRAVFPKNGYAWEFNYRGTLEFLRQAESQALPRGLMVEDGVTYFVYGWALVMEEVFGRPLEPEQLKAFCRIAYEALGRPDDACR
jgi:shikimate 5-dehydrogenase